MIAEVGVEMKVVHETQRSTTALALAASGLGLAILPKLALRPGMYPNLRTIPLVGPVMKRELALIRRKGATLSPAAQPLYDIVRHDVQNFSSRVRTSK
jgi:DNA-binding transcriptional LysR family regulator